MRLPDPLASQAILVGISGYQSVTLPDLPAVQNNVTALSQVLAAPESGGFSADRCTILADAQSVREVYRSLRHIAADTTDTLLFYYAGHGLTSTQNELYLSLSDTDPDELVVSALPYSLVREIIGESRARNRVVILDCCFSGRAIQAMSGVNETLAGQIAIEGAYTLTSTTANAVALAPEGATYTAFTGELLNLLNTGLPDGSELLTISSLYPQLLRTMTARGLPRPMCRGSGTVDQLALVRNPRAQQTFSLGARRKSTDVISLARRQREGEMELLIGTPQEAGRILDHQHLPDLYVDRPAPRRAWLNFLESEAIVFSAIGDAGRGKTSLMCSLATELGEVAPVFFYNGSQLDGRLSDALAQVLDIPKTDGDVMAAAADLVRRQGHTLYLFIDALNERAANRDELRTELNRLAASIRTHGWPIRLVVSCRSGDWLFWIRNANHMLGHFGRAVYRDEQLTDGSVPGTPVTAFDPAEVERAWSRYRRGFDLTGTLTNELRSLCREPIFLRLIAEMYRGGSLTLDRGFNRPMLIDRFFEERFPDRSDHMEVMAVLFRLSELMLERQRPSVPVNALPPENLPVCRRLMAEGVLTEKNGALGFRFEIVLEHIVARHLRQELSDRPDVAEVVALITSLTRSRLINSPGITESLLLSLHDRPDSTLKSLEKLSKMDDRWRAVACAVAAQSDLPPRRLLPVMRTLTAADNYLIRNRSAESIVRWIDRQADAEVLACTVGDDWESRETVAQALGRARSPSPESTHLLWKLADDYHWRVRRASGYSLLRTWDQRAVQELAWRNLEQLEQVSWRRRHAICVGMVGCKLSIDSPESRAIETMSHDDNPQIRWCVANYLSRYENAAESAVSAVLAADSSEWVRARVVTSLIGLVKETPGIVLPLLQQLASDPSTTVRLKMARELPGLEDAAARTALLKSLVDDTDEVSFAARYSLGLISDFHDTLSSSAGRAVVLKIFRERIARRNIDLTHAQFSKYQSFISERAEVPLGEDPYMHLVDTMCSLTTAAMTALQEAPAAVGELMELLEQDADEAIRWALVLFLARYSSRVLMSASSRMAGLERLSRDPHWWVRREVANGLAEFRDGPNAAQAIRLLTQLRREENQRTEPCGDEVIFFLDRSARLLHATATAERPRRSEVPQEGEDVR